MIVEIEINIRVHGNNNQDTYTFNRYSENYFYNSEISNRVAVDLLGGLADSSIDLMLKDLKNHSS